MTTYSEVEKKIKEQQGEYDELMAQFKDLQKRQERLNSEKYDMEREVDGHSSKLAGREGEYQVLLKDYEYAKEREAVLMGDRCVKRRRVSAAVSGWLFLLYDCTSTGRHLFFITK